MFSNLRDLECNSLLDPDQLIFLPRLVRLKISLSVKVLQKLPADTLTSLHMADVKIENGSNEEIEQLFAAFSRLTRLKSLMLGCGVQCFIPDR